MKTYAALTFNPIGDPKAPNALMAQQVDGELVGVIDPAQGGGYWVAMVDTRGNFVSIGPRQQFAAAQRLMLKAWQLQLSKGGNP